jgi:hypothetical protein
MYSFDYGEYKKAITIKDCGGPLGCETSRFSHFLDKWLTDGGEIISLTQPVGHCLFPGSSLVLISDSRGLIGLIAGSIRSSEKSSDLTGS